MVNINDRIMQKNAENWFLQNLQIFAKFKLHDRTDDHFSSLAYFDIFYGLAAILEKPKIAVSTGNFIPPLDLKSEF